MDSNTLLSALTGIVCIVIGWFGRNATGNQGLTLRAMAWGLLLVGGMLVLLAIPDLVNYLRQ